jgi:hypothetical protein
MGSINGLDTQVLSDLGGVEMWGSREVREKLELEQQVR